MLGIRGRPGPMMRRAAQIRLAARGGFGLTMASNAFRNVAHLVPPLAASIPITIFSVAALALPLATAQALGLSSRQTSAWIFALHAAPGLASIGLTLVYRQPLLVAWHTAVVAFVASLALTVPYDEILGAMMAAGLVVAALGRWD